MQIKDKTLGGETYNGKTQAVRKQHGPQAGGRPLGGPHRGGRKENGDLIFRYTYADTQKELTAKLRQDITAYQGVDLTEECRMPLSEWLDRWLEQITSVLQSSTPEHYRSDMEHHVKLYLG